MILSLSFGEILITFGALLPIVLSEVEDTPNRTAFVDGGTVLKIPLFYLEGLPSLH